MKGSQILWLSIALTGLILFGFNYPLILLKIIIILVKLISMIIVIVWLGGIVAIYDNDIDFVKTTLNPIYWLIYRPIKFINKLADKYLNPNK